MLPRPNLEMQMTWFGNEIIEEPLLRLRGFPLLFLFEESVDLNRESHADDMYWRLLLKLLLTKRVLLEQFVWAA